MTSTIAVFGNRDIKKKFCLAGAFNWGVSLARMFVARVSRSQQNHPCLFSGSPVCVNFSLQQGDMDSQMVKANSAVCSVMVLLNLVGGFSEELSKIFNNNKGAEVVANKAK